MSGTHVIELAGCTPEPLMSYLKALGILRLVSEQADPDARGCWRNEQFVLESRLNEDDLFDFFILRYAPTCILGPWAGGSGFFGKDNTSAVEAIRGSQSVRTDSYRRAIGRAREILASEKITEKPSETVKAHLIRRYRREMPDDFVQWMDAAMALQTEGQSFAPVLGTGGNDGRLDFTQNFMQRIVDMKLHEDQPNSIVGPILRASLFGEPVRGLGKAAVGQFAPGRSGGPNATQGMEGGSTDNSWDFVLGLEGSLVLAGAAVRRMGVNSTDRAAFPFTVRSRAVGDAVSSEEETGAARGELWLPLWSRFASASEIDILFSEGRADLAGRPARDAVEFSRAVVGLGMDRGIESFCRYGLLKRSGKAFLAVAQERFKVPTDRREAADLLFQIDLWLNDFRRSCSARETPQRLKTALRRTESAVFDYCRHGRGADLQTVLIALGLAERELAVTGGQRGGKQICRPVPKLSAEWLRATNDGSPEFEIALALAGTHDAGNNLPPIRANLAPVKLDRKRWVWGEAGRSVVWKSAHLADNLVAVLERRLLDGGGKQSDQSPIDFRRGVRLDVVALFLGGSDYVDDRRIDELLWGLSFVDSSRGTELPFQSIAQAAPLPRAYAMLKPLFLPRSPMRDRTGHWQYAQWASGSIVSEPNLLPLLRAGRVAEACRIAVRRMRLNGLSPLLQANPADMLCEVGVGLDPLRLAAALLLPLRPDEIGTLLDLVTRVSTETQPTKPKESRSHERNKCQ